MRDALRLWAICAASLGWAAHVHAHSVAQSTSTWQLASNHVRMRYSIPQDEVLRLSPVSIDEGSLTVTLARHLEKTISVSRGHSACVAAGESHAFLSASGTLSVEQDFLCAGEGDISLTIDAFFAVSPSHVHLARIVSAGETVTELVFTRSNTQQSFHADAAGSASSRLGTLLRYAGVGVWHIAEGPDHIGFLLGLLLLAPTLRRVLALTLGFTLGHSATLALVTLQVLRPNAPVIESLVGFSVLLVAAEALVERGNAVAPVSIGCAAAAAIAGVAAWLSPDSRAPLGVAVGLAVLAPSYLVLSRRQLASSARFQTGMTVSFGLIHGMAFASGLQEMQVPRADLLPALAGFNVGVEAGQVLFVLLALGVARAAAVWGGPQWVRFGERLAIVMLCALGTWWFTFRFVQA